MSFKDLSELLEADLPLPIRGKVYRISSPDVTVGLRAQATVAIASKVQSGSELTEEDIASLKLDDSQEMEFTQQMLGEQFAVMQADGVPWEYVRHAAKTVFAWLISDRDAAEKVWASAGNAPRPVPQDRKAPARRAPAKKAAAKKTAAGSTKKAI